MSMILKSNFVITLVVGASLALTACSTPSGGKFASKNQMQKKYQGNIPTYYTVRSGDTLSQIASRYGIDYRRLGALNGLNGNYTIKVGQRLRLTPPSSVQSTYQNVTKPVYQPTPTPKPSYPVVRPVQPQPYIPVAPIVKAPVNNIPVVNVPVNTALVVKEPTPPVQTANNRWLVPVSGRVVRGFDEMAGIKGIWFATTQGSPVVASKDGTVIYAGNGLPEYGNLIMISHSDDYITAYAHLGNFTVNEKQIVKAGQQIGTVNFVQILNQPALEFQIRYKGMPINPINMLK